VTGAFTGAAWFGWRNLRRKDDAKPDAAVVSIRVNAIAPEHSAMQIPVVMTPAAQPSFHAGTEIRSAIRRHGAEIVSAHVLTIFSGPPAIFSERAAHPVGTLQ